MSNDTGDFSGRKKKKSHENEPLAEKGQDKKSNKTREEIETGNQIATLRFQTQGPIRHPQPPVGR